MDKPDITESSASTQGRPLSVDRLLREPAIVALIECYGRQATLAILRAELAARRQRPSRPGIDIEVLARTCAESLDAQHSPSLRPVFNLTGTILHTNLGRALLPTEAVDAVKAVMVQASNLEFDLAQGARGERDDHVENLVCSLTGAQAATIVNNNAAAVLILLNTFAMGREAIVSRGELVEIGGAFRIPDVMVRAGARLREVGTTNRTHRRDFVEAIGPDTAVVLKVHTSNYRIEGFTAAVPAADLAALCDEHGLVFAEDLGSGTLVDLSRWGLPREPTVQESLAHAALVTFSGDKLLGGAQCGIIAGRRDLVEQIRRNPLKRALRVDKMTLAAMGAVLRLYLDPDRLADRLPTLRLLSRSAADIAAAAERLRPVVASTLAKRADVTAAPCLSQIGSGALPLSLLDSAALVIHPNAERRPGQGLACLIEAFLKLPVPVIGRREDGALWLDLRALEDERGFLAQIGQIDVDWKRPRTG